jgi:DNA helicase IV
MTVVGDLAQAGSPTAPREWGDVFDRVAPGRWSVQQLTVNYRTPAPMMQLAARVLRASGSEVVAPSSVRDGAQPHVHRVVVGRGADGAERAVPPDHGHPVSESHALSAAAAQWIERWVQQEGRTAVVTPADQHASVAAALARHLPSGTLGAGTAALESPVNVLTVAQAKGLEFDQVVVLEPAAILAESVRGGHDLYVALTRATQELVVLHTGELPAGFDSPEEAASEGTEARSA